MENARIKRLLWILAAVLGIGLMIGSLIGYGIGKKQREVLRQASGQKAEETPEQRDIKDLKDRSAASIKALKILVEQFPTKERCRVADRMIRHADLYTNKYEQRDLMEGCEKYLEIAKPKYIIP